MLKKLDRYLLQHFFASLAVVTLAIGLTIVVINMVEELRDFVDHDVPFLSILEYYLYFAGWILRSFLPMFVLLATLFSISILARKNEVLAMKASGVSLYRITVPFLVVALLISVGHFAYNEYLFPEANKRRLEIKKFTIEARSRTSVTNVRNVRRQIKPGHFYTIAHFDVDRKQGTDFRLFRTEGNRLDEFTNSKKVIYQDYRWLAVDGIRRTYSGGASASFVEFDTLVIDDIDDKPEDLKRWIGKPEDMGLDELKRYIKLMKRTGGPYQRELVDLATKYSYPLTSFIVVLVCVPFAANPRRSGIAVSIAAGALTALTYFVLFRIFQSAGHNGKIPYLVAAWGINGLFFVTGIIFMLKARK